MSIQISKIRWSRVGLLVCCVGIVANALFTAWLRQGIRSNQALAAERLGTDSGASEEGSPEVLGAPPEENHTICLGLPFGSIVAWLPSVAEDQPPQGWLVCNGENNTPDLRGAVPAWHNQSRRD